MVLPNGLYKKRLSDLVKKKGSFLNFKVGYGKIKNNLNETEMFS